MARRAPPRCLPNSCNPVKTLRPARPRPPPASSTAWPSGWSPGCPWPALRWGVRLPGMTPSWPDVGSHFLVGRPHPTSMNCLMPWVASQVTAWPERRGSGVPAGREEGRYPGGCPLALGQQQNCLSRQADSHRHGRCWDASGRGPQALRSQSTCLIPPGSSRGVISPLRRLIRPAYLVGANGRAVRIHGTSPLLTRGAL